MASALYDVAIIGGGPAGSIAAASLALAGRKVAVFEREKFPRFHIGESLLPFSMEAFERLGLMPKLEAAGFVRKYGAEITSGCGSGEIRFALRWRLWLFHLIVGIQRVIPIFPKLPLVPRAP